MRRSPKAFVGRIVADLELKELQGRPQTTKRKLGTLIKGCGWQKRSAERLAELMHLLADQGVFPDPDISDIHLPLDTYVTFGREPPTPIGQTIHPERALAYVLSKYPHHLETALSDLGRLKLQSGGTKPERTYYLGDKPVRPDLLFSSTSGRWLVCELETGEPRQESIEQLLRYMKAVETPGRAGKITGLLVTGQPRTSGLHGRVAEEMEGRRSGGLDMRWIIYDVDIVLASVIS